MAAFQIKLGGDWKAYDDAEDKILKRAFMAGFPNAKFELRGQHYSYDFKRLKQVNKDTGKERDIRPPFKWKAPAKPIVAAGPTTSITVPDGAPGTTIGIPHPKDPSRMIAVNVPAKAKAGQAMLVPVPTDPNGPGTFAADDPKSSGAVPAKAKGKSSGAKVAMKVGGVAIVGGAAVGAGVLGMYAAEHGIDATGDMLADGAGDAADALGDAAGAAGDALDPAADAIGDFAADAGDFLGDGADAAGDFIMDLF